MNVLIIIGLGLNLLGTIVLIFPALYAKEWIDDNEIVNDGKDKKGYWTITNGRKKIKLFSLLGLTLIALGFAFQIIFFI